MVYLRSKKVKGIEYVYLVRSLWDPKNSTSKQETIKYLGKARDVTPSDIPDDYRNDPKVIAFLSSHNPIKSKTNERMQTKLQNEIFKKMSNGDLDNTVSLFETFSKSSTLTEFYDKILKPVMYNIGDLWEKKKITTATEHISSNVAHSLIKIINQKVSISNNKGKILICTPEGEWHNLGCNIIESVLLSKGYSVQNISPSLPHDSIINHIQSIQPDAIVISITLKENVRSGQRLIQKIKMKKSPPVLIGGQAVKVSKEEKFEALTMKEGTIDEMLKLLKSVMGKKRDRT
ncbi:MAG TPA: cobalamin B12-binding domain-containing protein [Nitrosopumilaceae archaeon]|nr:cobalamin B12-binding domain-containing protein [Nitrosopumilaceae archaeon]